MKQQNDWYTGINHYDNYVEKEIGIERRSIDGPTDPYLHECVELFYVLSGKGVISVNGYVYDAVPGSLFCMYSHHLHHVEALVKSLLREAKEARFERQNMIEYKTLELHTYYCRYAYEEIGRGSRKERTVWRVIEKVILSTGEDITLQDMTEEEGLSSETLNRRIKEACGFTFFQLKQFGKVINACALLHFPELSMEYISDQLNFSSAVAFYKVFKQYCGVTLREYQAENIGIMPPGSGVGSAMRFLQYIHIHFSEDISFHDLCERFCMKPYTVKQIFKQVFGNPFEELLAQVRISYACSFLRTGDSTVLEIASLCGFNSQSTFLRHFKRWMNQTPEEYRKSMREDTEKR